MAGRFPRVLMVGRGWVAVCARLWRLRMEWGERGGLNVEGRFLTSRGRVSLDPHLSAGTWVWSGACRINANSQSLFSFVEITEMSIFQISASLWSRLNIS